MTSPSVVASSEAVTSSGVYDTVLEAIGSSTEALSKLCEVSTAVELSMTSGPFFALSFVVGIAVSGGESDTDAGG